jgi:prefoldin subunit 5
MLTKAETKSLKYDINDAIEELKKVKAMLKTIKDEDKERQIFLQSQIFDTLNHNVRTSMSSAVSKAINLTSSIYNNN